MIDLRHTVSHTHTHTLILPSEQPLVDGGQCEHFEQQPNGKREEDQSERLNEQVEANVKQRTGQLLQREEVKTLITHINLPPSSLYIRYL